MEYHLSEAFPALVRSTVSFLCWIGDGLFGLDWGVRGWVFDLRFVLFYFFLVDFVWFSGLIVLLHPKFGVRSNLGPRKVLRPRNDVWKITPSDAEHMPILSIFRVWVKSIGWIAGIQSLVPWRHSGFLSKMRGPPSRPWGSLWLWKGDENPVALPNPPQVGVPGECIILGLAKLGRAGQLTVQSTNFEKGGQKLLKMVWLGVLPSELWLEKKMLQPSWVWVYFAIWASIPSRKPLGGRRGENNSSAISLSQFYSRMSRKSLAKNQIVFFYECS